MHLSQLSASSPWLQRVVAVRTGGLGCGPARPPPLTVSPFVCDSASIVSAVVTGDLGPEVGVGQW